MAKLELLTVLEGATEQDLQTVREKIAEKQKEIDSLLAVEKVLCVRLHGKPERKNAAKKNAAVDGGDDSMKAKRAKVGRHLAAKGSMTLDRLSQEVSISRFGPGAIGSVLQCDLFHVRPDGQVSLTDKGMQFYKVA